MNNLFKPITVESYSDKLIDYITDQINKSDEIQSQRTATICNESDEWAIHFRCQLTHDKMNEYPFKELKRLSIFYIHVYHNGFRVEVKDLDRIIEAIEKSFYISK